MFYFLLFLLLLLLSFKWNYRKSFFTGYMSGCLRRWLHLVPEHKCLGTNGKWCYFHTLRTWYVTVHYLLPYTLSDATMTLELSNQYGSELSRELTKTVCSEAAYSVSEYKVQTLYSSTSTFWKMGVFSMYLTRAPSVNTALWAPLCKFVVFSYF